MSHIVYPATRWKVCSVMLSNALQRSVALNTFTMRSTLEEVSASLRYQDYRSEQTVETNKRALDRNKKGDV